MEDNWRHDPFEVHSEDGWLYGRGTTDNKGELIVCPARQQPPHTHQCRYCPSGCLPARWAYLTN
jgi:hypothetical protein